MQWTSHCVSRQIDFVGVLVGLWPRFLWCFCWFCCLLWFSAGETQVWLGDLRVVVLFGFCGYVWFIDLPAPLDMIVLCTNIFSAYDHVRTEPSARHRPHSRKKIKNIDTGKLTTALATMGSGQPVPHGDKTSQPRSEQWLNVMHGNRGYPTLALVAYWNCTGWLVQGFSRLPVLLDVVFAGGGSLLSAGFIIWAISG